MARINESWLTHVNVRGLTRVNDTVFTGVNDQEKTPSLRGIDDRQQVLIGSVSSLPLIIDMRQLPCH